MISSTFETVDGETVNSYLAMADLTLISYSPSVMVSTTALYTSPLLVRLA